MKRIEGGITAPKGFRASGIAADIKPGSFRKDCALIVSDVPGTVAGMFTQNILRAPSVNWNRGICGQGRAQAVFINSGNANAATGAQGDADVAATAEAVAKALEVPPNTVCVCSTGVIGVPLPMERILKGVHAAVAALSASRSHDAAQAIMTTDTVPKEAAFEAPLASGTVRIGAIAKGSGMIAPRMATMICIVTTDAAVETDVLDCLLRAAVSGSFNQICVDNDTSTSDTVLCLANGAAGVAVESDADKAAFGRALHEVCLEMAKAIVHDGEGATKFVEVVVAGTPTNTDAEVIARTIATSQLCKTAFFGQDPNWGRIACAAGYAGVAFDPDRVGIWIDDVQVMRNGTAAGYIEADAAACMRKPEFRIRVEVGDGPGNAVFWTSDLSVDYVRINAQYRT